MKELVFALEFKGRAEPVAGAEGKLRAKTSASSQLLRSIVKPDGLRATVEAADGGSATFESEVQGQWRDRRPDQDGRARQRGRHARALSAAQGGLAAPARPPCAHPPSVVPRGQRIMPAPAGLALSPFDQVVRPPQERG